ncbi:MAG: CDP-alcohol phosphatidyltransferase family protein [Verrucomicrobiota bacterium]
MTTANKVTIVRILLVPFFVVLGIYYVTSGEEIYRLLAILCFAVAAISDGIDGYIARRYHQQSDLGTVLDPLADKMLLLSAIALLGLNNEPFLHRLPLWLTATVISRDAVLSIGIAVVHYTCGKVALRPHPISKVATVLQMITVSWVLLKWDAVWLHWFAVGAAVCTGVSVVPYLIDGIRQLNASPASAPKANP